jgi:hypothetical protein
MTPATKGQRHRLYLYTHMVDRLWSPLFPLGLALSGWMWFSGKYWPNIGFIPSTPPPYDLIIYVGIVLIFGITLTSWIIRRMAYVQARSDHLRVVTPFLVVKISYRRLLRSYPSQVSQLFAGAKVKRSVRSLMEGFEGKTALVLELKGYPLSRSVLKFFLGEAMLNPAGDGLVVLVPDWMDLSTEITSFQSTARQKQKGTLTDANPGYGLLNSLRKK